MKKCTNCGVEKLLTDFAKKAGNKDGYRPNCRECNKLSAGILTKKCPRCGTEKSVTQFHNAASRAGGLSCWCKMCDAAAGQTRFLRDPAKGRAIKTRAALKHSYGITPEEKEALIVGQKGLCSCCGDPFANYRKAHVDHIHGSDPIIIRGILCAKCNSGLGFFKDSPERLLKAVAYLKKFQVSA